MLELKRQRLLVSHVVAGKPGRHAEAQQADAQYQKHRLPGLALCQCFHTVDRNLHFDGTEQLV